MSSIEDKVKLNEQKNKVINDPDDEERLLKGKVIEYALRKKSISLLEHLGGTHFGFVNNQSRCECWSFLLKNQLKKSKKYKLEAQQHQKESLSIAHIDEHQVQLDVDRSFTTLSTGILKDNSKLILKHFIVKILRLHPSLRYYQGYHDVISVFVMVYFNAFPENHTKWNVQSDNIEQLLTPSVEKSLYDDIESFTLLYLRDFMTDSLYFPIDQLKIIPKLVQVKDDELFQELHLDRSDPFFAVSSILTIYSHELKIDPHTYGNDILFSIFDMIISQKNMLIPLFIYSNFIVNAKKDLLINYNENISNFENENDLIQVIIQKQLAQDILKVDIWQKILIETAKCPLLDRKDLKYLNINEYSVLLTTASGWNRTSDILDIGKALEYMQNEVNINERRKAKEISKKKRALMKFRIIHVIKKYELLLLLKISLLFAFFVFAFSYKTQLPATYKMHWHIFRIQSSFSSQMYVTVKDYYHYIFDYFNKAVSKN